MKLNQFVSIIKNIKNTFNTFSYGRCGYKFLYTKVFAIINIYLGMFEVSEAYVKESNRNKRISTLKVTFS